MSIYCYLPLLVESMIWQDRNLKFGPNYDLEVINLEEKNLIWLGKAQIEKKLILMGLHFK